MDESEYALGRILQFLRDDGVSFLPIGTSDNFEVGPESTRPFRYRPVLTIPGDLLIEYLKDMGENFRDEADPFSEALSMTEIHLVEYLRTDHGSGSNATTAIGFRKGSNGEVELFVEKDCPRLEESADPEEGELRWGS